MSDNNKIEVEEANNNCDLTNKINTLRKYYKNTSGDKNDNEKIFSNALLNFIDVNNENFKKIHNKMVDNDKYDYKIKKNKITKSYKLIEISNGRLTIKFFIYQLGIYIITKNNHAFKFLDSNIIDNLNELIKLCGFINRRSNKKSLKEGKKNPINNNEKNQKNCECECGCKACNKRN